MISIIDLATIIIELSMDKRDSSDFYLTQRICLVSDRSNWTSGTRVDKLLGLCMLYGTCDAAAYCAIMCYVHPFFRARNKAHVLVGHC